MDRPSRTIRMLHVALCVNNLEACERFYIDVLGMRVEWRPDPDNVYLTGGFDNLALHRVSDKLADSNQRLDHFGFLVDQLELVDQWFAYMSEQDIKIVRPPHTHRDGARSFYCLDPDGNTVQLIYHPSLVNS